jgi:ubiquinone/menaquinone biosynthesis C-methylase UbiE
MAKFLRKFLLADEHVCPWWLAYTFDNPFRKILHPPEKVLGGLIRKGQTALDIGCGMGYFTLALADMVGEQGRVFSVDIQEKMLARVLMRAKKRGLEKRIHLHKGEITGLGMHGTVDFAIAFWMVHEVPDQVSFLKAVRETLKPGALFLVAEPKIHTSASDFQTTLNFAHEAGLRVYGKPRIRISRAVILTPDINWMR